MRRNKKLALEVSQEVFEHVVEWHECPTCGARVNPVYITEDSKGRRKLSMHCYKCKETKRLVVAGEEQGNDIVMAYTDEFKNVNWDKMPGMSGSGDEHGE